MTALEPGASDVFTHGLVLRPFSTAFLATSPAATITDGFDVFVQLVMAAITTEPFVRCPSGVSAALPIPLRAASQAAFDSRRGTRSWGRLGPARLGSTVARSRA